jgi:aryl-alcohol dehydrogenase-like predicted oxidoreductase
MSTARSVDRRSFLTMAAAAAASACARPAAPPRAGQTKLTAGGNVPKRKLGRTGVQVSCVGLGGYHLAEHAREEEAIRIVRMAIDHGITFLDNCWDYNEGKSEERMGKALGEGYRHRAFLMTKLDGRTKEAAAAQLEQSLRRLRTDFIDLVQVHEVIRMTDPDRVFGPGGAMEALLDAKKAGKLRFIGFTGHKDPSIHLAMLRAAELAGFTFDTVQMPVNVMDAHYRSFQKEVIPELVKKDIGVLGMKSMSAGELLKSGVVSAEDCLRWSLSQPTSVVITGCDSVGVLEQALDVAMRFQPLSPKERDAMLARTAPVAGEGKYEPFKTSKKHDGTAEHPKWLESAEL